MAIACLHYVTICLATLATMPNQRLKHLFLFFLVCSQNIHGSSADNDASTNVVPDYHVPMLNDITRNDAYYKALAKIITSESIVVDVGAGSGLLSCMAAKLGAKKVFAVEKEETLCNVVLPQIIADNNFTHIIQPLCLDSLFLTADDLIFVDEDGSQKAPTVLVSETLDSYIVGEGFLSMLYDWKYRQVIPVDITIIPHHGRLFMQLQQSSNLLNEHKTVAGFNFTALDQYRVKDRITVGHSMEGFHKNLSDAWPIIDFEFQGSTEADDFSHYVYIDVPIVEQGRLTGAMFFFEVWLDKEETISINNFVGSPTHWKQLERIFDWTQPVRPGDKVHLQIGQLRERLVIANAATSRLVRIYNHCDEPIHLYASKAGDDNNKCGVQDEDFLFTFDVKGAYNLWAGYLGQEYIAKVISTGQLLPAVVLQEDPEEDSNSDVPALLEIVMCA